MQKTRFGQRLVIVLGCLGLILAAMQGRLTPDIAAAVPDQMDAICNKQACTKVAKVVDHSNCPFNGQPVRGSCLFDSSKGDLVWCDATTGSTCSIQNPIESNWCVGYCENMPSLSCDSTKYNKCKNP